MTENAQAEPQGDTDAPDPQGSQQQDTPQGDKPADNAEPQGHDVEDTAADWQALARKWESRAKKDAKAVADLKDQVKRLVDPDEAEKQVKSVEEQLTATMQERDTLQAEVLRLRVALETGLPPDLARRLVGDTEDDLRADADTLKAFAAPKVGTPHAKTGAGENGASPTPFDAKRVAAEAAARSPF